MQLVRSWFFKKDHHDSLDQVHSASLSAAASSPSDRELLVSRATGELFSNSASATGPQRKILGAAQGKACSEQLNQEYPFLLTPSLRSALSKVPQDKKEWYINLFLMMDIYKQTKDPKLQHLVSFLVLNYLAKAAPICFYNVNPEIVDQLTQMFQRSMPESEEVSYNRESPAFDAYLFAKIANELAIDSGGDFFIVDTKKIASFFPLFFLVAHGKQVDWERLITSSVLEHIKKHPENPFEFPLSSLILFDMTSYLDQHLVSCGNEIENQLFKEKLQKFEMILNRVVEKTIKNLLDIFSKSAEIRCDENQLRNFIVKSIICTCCGDVRGIGTLHILPIFIGSQRFDQAHAVINNFLNGTGIRLGSVSGRDKVFNFFSLEEFLESFEIPFDKDIKLKKYPKNIRLEFKNKLDFLLSPVYKKTVEIFSQDRGRSFVTILGVSTLDLLNGVLTEINDAQWSQLNSNPEYRQLIQITLYKIECQLDLAGKCIGNFNAFTDVIERIHYEIAALLAIFSPFEPSDFSSIYQKRLTIIPESLKRYVHAGLTKSGMNTFAAISIASGIDSVKAVHRESHFELLQFIGITHNLENVLADQLVQKVDVLFTEFYHNISLYSDHTTYSTVDVIGDVERVLREKPLTEHLTVGIDATIDHVNSFKLKALFEHFEAQTLEGKLNIIVIRSGQKCDMFGMDNYYGSPFYIVNNGGPQWDNYKKLTNNQEFATDLLSTQWFCLVHKYTPQLLDEYKNAIFKNTKVILANVPCDVKPGGNSNLRVCNVSEDSESCLIDIKCHGKKSESIRYQVEDLFFEKLVANNIRVHRRAGYGYFNVNFNAYSVGLDVSRLSTIRINPGINQSENQTIIEFLRQLRTLEGKSG